MKTEELIQRLSGGLSPTPQVWPFWRVLLVWLLVSSAYVAVMILLLGPYEPTHILQNHVFPILVLAGVVGAVAFTIIRFSKQGTDDQL